MAGISAQVEVLRPFLRGAQSRRLAWFAATLVATSAALAALITLVAAIRMVVATFGVPVSQTGLLSWLELTARMANPPGAAPVASRVLLAGGLVWACLLIWLAARAVECRLAGSIIAQSEARIRRAVYRQAHRLAPPLERTLGANQPVGYEAVLAQMPNLRRALAAWLELSQREPVPMVVFGALALAVAPLQSIAAAALMALALVSAGLGVRRIRSVLARREQRAIQEERLLSESLDYVQMAKALLMDDVVHRRFEDVLADLVRVRSGDLALARLTWPVVLFALSLGAATFAVLLLYQLAVRNLYVDTALLLLGALLLAVLPAQNAWGAIQTLKASHTACEPLAEFLQREPEVLQLPDARFLDPLSRELRFRHVSVMRGGRVYLRDYNIAIEAGSIVAVLSTDRASYRAIAYLVTRLIDPDEGQILIDGRDIRKATLESLRANVGIALDGYYVFTASVRANIAGGEQQRPFAEIVEAAKRAHAHSFVQRLAEGYDTVIGPLGEQLTIGEQFRIALARLIVQNPALAVIEEPWQPMDEEARQLVDDALRWFCRDRTVLFLARRLSTLKQADAVVVLKDGAVAAVGSHEELTRNSELYRHLQYLLGQRHRGVLAVTTARTRS